MNKKLLVLLIDTIHLLFMFTPIILFLIPKKYFYITKYVVLIIFLTPLHWVFLKNNCILTLLSKKYGGFKNQKTNSPFTEKYFSIFYDPIFTLLNIERNKENYDMVANYFCFLQWIIIYTLLIYYIYLCVKKQKNKSK